MRGKWIFWVFLSVSAFLVGILAANYAAGLGRNGQNLMPYGLSLRARRFVLEGKADGGLEALRSLETESLVAVLEKRNGEALGIYDPQMAWPSEGFVRIQPGAASYFSEEDYKKGEKKMVYLNGEAGREQRNGFSAAWNLFALKPEEGDLVYVDSVSAEALEQAEELLLRQGYRRWETDGRREESLGNLLSRGLAARDGFFLLAVAGSVLLFYGAAFSLCMKKTREAYGRDISGTDKAFLFLATAAGCLAAGLMVRLTAAEGWNLSVEHFLTVLLLYLAYAGILYWFPSGTARRRKKGKEAEG